MLYKYVSVYIKYLHYIYVTRYINRTYICVVKGGQGAMAPPNF